MSEMYTATVAELLARGEDMTDFLQNAIDAAGEGAEICLPVGEVRVSRTLYVRDKKNLKIVGGGTHFLHTGYDMMTRESQRETGLFLLERCENVTLAGFSVDYEGFVSIAGEVSAMNTEGEPYFDMKLYPEFLSVTGEEYYRTALSFDPDGAPNYHLAGDGGGMRTEKIAGDTLRVYYQNAGQIARLSLGEAMNIRIGMNGAAVFTNLASDGTLFKDITIYQAISCSFLIGARSGSVTFDGLKITFKEGTDRLMTSNVDAIHIKGMTGKLTVRNSVFDGLGDDAVNVHSRAGILTTFDPAAREVHFVDGWSKTPCDAFWAFPGDTVEFYDPKTFLAKGTATVESYTGDMLTLDRLPEGTSEGDILANLTYLPAVEITGCTVTRNRARAFLIQTRNVLIENCVMNRISLPAIIVAPDIQRWFEVGPARNVVIRNNRMEKCAFIPDCANMGTVMVKASHDHGYADYPAGVHRDIVIEGNEISETANSAIFVSATAGIRVANNRIRRFGVHRNHQTGEEAICFVNCTEIDEQGNVVE